MSLSFPKIRVGKFGSGRKPNDLSHSNTTTADFGFCQPMSCALITGKSSFNVNLATQVMLNPLNAPTYGKIMFNLYHAFVPIAELFPPFEEMLGEIPYSSTKVTQVPKGVPYIRVCDYTRLLFASYICNYTIYKGSVNTYYDPIPASGVGAAIQLLNNKYPYVDSTSTFFEDDTCTNNHTKYTPVEIEGADYVIRLTSGSDSYIYAFRFSATVKRLRKVLTGLGYPLDLSSKRKLNAMPLFAYYRVWFELFAPKQVISWQSTNAYKILDTIREEGVTYLPVMKQYQHVQDRKNIIEKFFFEDLANTYFTEDPNFVSAHISMPSATFDSSSVSLSSPTALDKTLPIQSGANQLPIIPYNSSLTAFGIDVLKRLSTRIGKQTILGANLQKVMKLLNNSDYVGQDKCYIFGTQRIPIRISDVVSNADTLDTGNGTGDVLGARGAQGNGDNFRDQKSFKFETDSEGYYICIGVVVTESGYFQGVPGYLTQVETNDFFHSEYDALGYELTLKDQIVGTKDVILDESPSEPAAFGFIPRYTAAYKHHYNIINGDISLRSARSSLLTFSLDKFITPNTMTSYKNSAGNTVVSTYSANLPIASTQWRYLNMYPWLGNLNRIFVNEGLGVEQKADSMTLTPIEQMEFNPILDNFIINSYIDLLAFEPVIPIKDSFDTDPFDNDSQEVTKA